jgi:hypothetical protein
MLAASDELIGLVKVFLAVAGIMVAFAMIVVVVYLIKKYR